MTNDVVDELWRIVTAALAGGQPSFQVQIFPFRMTDVKLAARSSPWSGFWAELKPGYDAFEQNDVPPAVNVCDGRYVIDGQSLEAGREPPGQGGASAWALRDA